MKRPELDKDNAYRAAAIAGAGLFVWGTRRRGNARTIATVTGSALVSAWLGRSAGASVRSASLRRRAANLQTSLVIRRPVHDVFEFLRDFENLPKVFGALESVVDYQNGKSLWRVRARNGTMIQWTVLTTKYVPNAVIAWQSAPGSAVEAGATVRLRPLRVGTRLDLQIWYRPTPQNTLNSVKALARPRVQNVVRTQVDRLPFYVESLPVEDDAAIDAEPPAA